MTRQTLLAAAIVLVLSACAGQTAPSNAGENAGTQTDAPTAAAGGSAAALEGTWTTDEMSSDQLQQAAIAAGQSDADVQQFFDEAFSGVETGSFQIRFLDGQANQFMTPGSGDPLPMHGGPYRLTDDQTLVWTDGDCDTTVAFELDGDMLTFGEILDEQCPAVDSQIAHITFLQSGPYTRSD